MRLIPAHNQPIAAMTTDDTCRIRAATGADVPLLLTLIRELAEYEKLLDQVTADEAGLHRSLFGPRPHAEAVIAEVAQDGSAVPAGLALFFHNFSTFVGKPGLYLEDLYVRPEFRRRGIGIALMRHLAGVAVERDCGRFEWWALDWNEPAQRFYKDLGAEPMGDWTVWRMTGAALRRLAE